LIFNGKVIHKYELNKISAGYNTSDERVFAKLDIGIENVEVIYDKCK